MNQEIAISIKNKIAETDFTEVVSFNSVYRLKFTFDEEWDEYYSRVAVVMWAGGVAEKLFTGTECEMPQITSLDADSVLIGVYSRYGEKRIASSFVCLRCEPGAGGFPQPKPTASLHEQILSFLNSQNWGTLEDIVEGGIYSAVLVDKKGRVTKGMKIIEVGKEEQDAPSKDLAPGGVFFRLKNGVYTICYKEGDDLRELSLSGVSGGGGSAGSLGHSLTVGEQVFDGTADVTVQLGALAPKDKVASGDIQNGAVTGEKLAENVVKGGEHISVTRDGGNNLVVEATNAVFSVNGESGDLTIDQDFLGLANVAYSGNYNDLVGAPTSGVTSVNGQTGKVVLDHHTLGLADVAMTGSYSDLTDKPDLGVTSVNGEKGDLTIDQDFLGLADIAYTGNYNDLVGAPTSGVSSVNGQTGKVVIDRHTLGLADVAVTGSYNDLKDVPKGVTSVNGETGDLTIDQDFLGLADVAYSGDFNDLVGAPSSGVYSVNGQTGRVVLDRHTLGLADVALTGSYHDLVDAPESGVISVNGQTGEVTIDRDTLGLAKVAISGSFNDLVDKESIVAGVSSINGLTGKVTLDASSLGLGALASKDKVMRGDFAAGSITTSDIATRSITGAHLIDASIMGTKLKDASITGVKLDADVVKAGSNISVTRDGSDNFIISTSLTTGVSSVNGKTGDVTIDKSALGLNDVISYSAEAESGADCDDLVCGLYSVIGTEEKPCYNTPVSLDNVNGRNCYWVLIGIPTSDRSRCVQVAFSGRSDGAARIRLLSTDGWTPWKSLAV